MTKIVKWVCDHCKQEFDTEEECVKHESFHRIPERVTRCAIRGREMIDLGGGEPWLVPRFIDVTFDDNSIMVYELRRDT